MNDENKFHIQRRNLLIISSIILFYELGNVTAGDTVSFPYMDVSVNNPNAIEIFLHATLIYFIWRYIVAFRTSSNLKEVWENCKNVIHNKMSDQAYKKAEQYLKSQKILYQNISFQKNNETGRYYTPLKGQNPLLKGALYSFRYLSKKGTSQKLPSDQDVQIKGFQLIYIKYTTLIKHILLTNLFLEFFFPFLLTLIALLQAFEIIDMNYFTTFLIW